MAERPHSAAWFVAFVSLLAMAGIGYLVASSWAPSDYERICVKTAPHDGVSYCEAWSFQRKPR